MEILNNFIDLQQSYNKIMPLAAIWLNAPVQTSTERTARIKEGDLIRVEKEWIVDVTPDKKPTHKVILCKGNIASTSLDMDIQDLKTNEISTLKLK